MFDNASRCSLTVHQNYVGTDAEKNPFLLSVVLSDQNSQRIPQYHSILWRKTVRNKYLTAALTSLFVLAILIISFFAFFRILVFNVYFSFYTTRTYNSTIEDSSKQTL